MRLVAFLFAAALAAAAQERPQDLPSLLPAETLFVAEWGDLGGADVWARDTAMGQILAEPEVARFLEGMHRSLLGLRSPLGGFGLGMQELSGLQIARAGFAVVDAGFGEEPWVDALVTLRFRSGADTAVKVYEGLRQTATAFLGVVFEGIEISGRRVWTTHAGGTDLFLSLSGDRFLATTRRVRMEQVLAALDSGEAAPLSASPAYRKALSGSPDLPRAALAFANVPAIGRRLMLMATVAGGQERAARFDHGWRALGLDAVESFLCVDLLDKPLFRTEMSLVLTERRGLFALEPPARLEHRFLGRVPAHALLYGAERADLAVQIRGIFDLVRSLDPRAHERMERGMAAVEQALGVDLRNALLPAVGPEWAAYVALPPAGGLIPDVVLFAGLRDRAQFESAIGKALASIRALLEKEEGIRSDLKTTECRGMAVQFLELTQRSGDPIPLCPCWAIAEDHVIFSLFPHSLRNMLDSRRPLSENEEFQSLRRRLPEGVVSSTWVDLRTLAGWAYNTAGPVLQGLQGAGNRQLAALGLRVNFEDLPSADTILRHLGGMLFYTASQSDRLRVGYVSPFGSAALSALVAPPVLLALAARGPGARERSDRRREEDVDARLDRLEREIEQLRREREKERENNR